MPAGENDAIFFGKKQRVLDVLKHALIDARLWAGVTILFGILECIGWIISFKPFLTIIPQSVSASPCSAIIFISLGACLYIYERRAGNCTLNCIYKGLMGISLLIIGLFFIITIYGFAGEVHGEVPIVGHISELLLHGHMSPISSLLFLFLITGIIGHRYFSFYGQAISLIITGAGAVMILGYWYGAPFLYGGLIKPVSFPTALGFLFIGISFLLTTRPPVIDRVILDSGSINSQILRFFVPFIVIILLLEGWIISFLLKKTDSSMVLTIAFITLGSIIITIFFSTSFSRIITTNLENAHRKRQAAERALLDSLIRVKIAADAAHMGFWVWDMKTDEVLWDERTYDLFGVAHGTSVTILDWIGRIHQDDRPDITRLKSLKETDEFHSEFRFVLSDSTIKTIEGHGKVLLSEDGTPDRMVGMNWDITPKISLIESLHQKNEQLTAAYEELTSQEEELRYQFRELARANDEILNTHRFLDEVISQAGEGIVVLDLNGNVQSWNNFMEEYTGIVSEDIIEKNFFDFPDFSLFSEETYSQCSHQGKRGVFPDISLSSKISGEKRWYTATCAPHYDNTETIIGTILTVKDISERKEMEEQLSRSTELLRTSQALAKIGGFEYNVHSGQMFWTDEAYHIHEIDPGTISTTDELLTISLSCYHEEDRPMIKRAFERCIKEGIPYEFEFPFRTVQGREIWIRTQARSEWENGSVCRVCGTIMDISREKSFIADIEKERLSLRSILDHMPDGVCIIDRESRIEYTNPVMEEWFGKPQGRLCYQYINNLQKLCPWCRVDTIYAGESYRDTMENAMNGRSYDMFATPFSSPDGDMKALKFFHDITDLREAERKLAEANEYLTRLIQYANVPIVVWNKNNEIVEFNSAFELLSGHLKEEVLGKPYPVLFPDENRGCVTHLFHQVTSAGRIFEKEMEIQRPDGAFIPVIWNASMVTGTKGELIAVIAQGRDITREKSLEKEKKVAIKQIQRNFAELAILNDGIRNPLTIMAMVVEMKCPEIYTDIETQIQHIDQIVNQLDERWMESESVLNYLQKHHDIHMDGCRVCDSGPFQRDSQP